MVEREHGAGRAADADRDEAAPQPTGFDPGQGQHASEPTKRARLAPRPDKGLSFAEALDETMRDHRTVFAALAK